MLLVFWSTLDDKCTKSVKDKVKSNLICEQVSAILQGLQDVSICWLKLNKGTKFKSQNLAVNFLKRSQKYTD